MKKIIPIIVVLMVSFRMMAGIVVKEINFHQHDAITIPWTLTLDLNDDGKPDVTFTALPWFRSLIMADSATMGTLILIPGETPGFLAEGDSIGNASEFMTGDFDLVSNDTARMPINTTLYLGYKLFNIKTLTWHYGWLSVKLDWFHEIFYIYESGYNDAEEMPIAAGQKTLSVSEPMADNIRIYSAGTDLVIENLPAGFSGWVTLYDLSGRTVAEILCGGNRVCLSGITLRGVYIVSLTSPRVNCSRKVFL